MKAYPANRFHLTSSAWQRLIRRVDPEYHRLKPFAKLHYSLGGLFHSLLRSVQIKSHAEALAGASVLPPIFILGFWRSGTTLLHELFCCDRRFGFPSTYACMNPSHFLLSEGWARRHASGSHRRPMDQMQYSLSSPQEDEFALFALGAPSPYEAILLPSLLKDAVHLLDLQMRSEEDRRYWAATFVQFLQLLTIQQRKPLILKSPSHGFRLPILQELFPHARYIVIDRNPYEVFASNLKLWRILVNLYGLEEVKEGEIERFLLSAYTLHERMVSEGVKVVPEGAVAFVRYEDLIAAPVKQMDGIYKTLGLGPITCIEGAMKSYLDQRQDYQRNHFILSRSQRSKVEAAWGSFLSRKGYSWPDKYLHISDQA